MSYAKFFTISITFFSAALFARLIKCQIQGENYANCFCLSGGGSFSVHLVLFIFHFLQFRFFDGLFLISLTITVNSVFHNPIKRLLSPGITPCFSLISEVSWKSWYQATTLWSVGAFLETNAFCFYTFLLSHIWTFFHNGPGSCFLIMRSSFTAFSTMCPCLSRLDSIHLFLNGHKTLSSSILHIAWSWVMNTTS